MNSLKAILTLLTAAILLTSTVPLRAQSSLADIEPAKRKEIEKLLELTGMSKLMGQMMDQMFASMKANGESEMTDEFLTRFRANVDTSELINQMIPIYDRHFSLEDIRSINAFYQTDAGKRMLASMPQVMADAMQVGQKWGQSIGEKVAEELKKERAAKKGGQ